MSRPARSYTASELMLSARVTNHEREQFFDIMERLRIVKVSDALRALIALGHKGLVAGEGGPFAPAASPAPAATSRPRRLGRDASPHLGRRSASSPARTEGYQMTGAPPETRAD